MTDRLHLGLLTPHGAVFDEPVLAARVPAESGQVGLRPREEPFILVVEPGLCILRGSRGVRFAATAGGLLEGSRERAVLYTPFAVLGDAEAGVLAALDQALAIPDSELALRRKLGELEERIVRELRHRPAAARAEITRG